MKCKIHITILLFITCLTFYGQDFSYGENFLNWVKNNAAKGSADLCQNDLKLRWKNYYLLTYESAIRTMSTLDSALALIENSTNNFEKKHINDNSDSASIRRKDQAYDALNDMLKLNNLRELPKYYFNQLDSIGTDIAFFRNGIQQVGRESFLESVVDYGEYLSENARSRYDIGFQVTIGSNGEAKLESLTGPSSVITSLLNDSPYLMPAAILLTGFMIINDNVQQNKIAEACKILPSKLIPITDVIKISKEEERKCYSENRQLDSSLRKLNYEVEKRYKQLLSYNIYRIKLAESVLTKSKVDYLTKKYNVDSNVKQIFNEYVLINIATEMGNSMKKLYLSLSEIEKTTSTDIENFAKIESYQDALLETKFIAEKFLTQSNLIPYHVYLLKQKSFCESELKKIPGYYNSLSTAASKSLNLSTSKNTALSLSVLSISPNFSKVKKYSISRKDENVNWSNYRSLVAELDRLISNESIYKKKLEEQSRQLDSKQFLQTDTFAQAAKENLFDDASFGLVFCYLRHDGKKYECSPNGNFNTKFKSGSSHDIDVLQAARDAGWLFDSRKVGSSAEEIQKNIELRNAQLKDEYDKLEHNTLAWRSKNTEELTRAKTQFSVINKEQKKAYENYKEINTPVESEITKHLDEFTTNPISEKQITKVISEAEMNNDVGKNIPKMNIRPNVASPTGDPIRKGVYDQNNSTLVNEAIYESNKQDGSFSEVMERFEQNQAQGKPDPLFKTIDELNDARRHANVCVKYALDIERDFEKIQVEYPGVNEKIKANWLLTAKIRRLKAQGYNPTSSIDFPYTVVDMKEMKNKIINIVSELVKDVTIPEFACNLFIGNVIEKVYNVKDFRTSTGGFLNANGIEMLVSKSDNWEIVGSATSQDANDKASYFATIGYPVIAVRYNPNGEGHICIVLPGLNMHNASANENYRKYNVKYVPNVSNYSHHHPEYSKIDDFLTIAYSDPTGVVFYRRKTIINK